jgi:prepilin peptidase CpaA
MEILTNLARGFVENWPIWLVSVVLIVAAIIDGVQLKVPNWLTFPFILSGWVFSALMFAQQGDPWWHGLGWSLWGTMVGLALLLPAYAIGGMGAGDVKLLMGVGAWVHCTVTWHAFCVSAVVGALLALLLIVVRRGWSRHYRQFWMILAEITTIRQPDRLAAIAAERKSSMLLLPYGIPIAMGTVLYFAWMGMFV